MRVAIPHSLDNETVRQRLKDKSGEIPDSIPGNATVTTQWPTEDRMTMQIQAMGQTIAGHVDLEPGQIVFEVPLPPALSFVEPIIAGAIRTSGVKLLAPPKD